MRHDPPSPDELQRAVDEHTLLAGEDPSSTYVDDAVHWIRVYGELVAVKTMLLQRAEYAMAELTDDAVSDLSIDQRLLRAQAERYRSRYAYWLARLSELATNNQRHQRGQRSPALTLEGSGDDASDVTRAER